MGDLLLRNVDETLVERLKSKAKLNGTSLQHEATKALERGAPLTPEERRRLFEEFERTVGFPKVNITGAEIVRAIRDGDEDED